MQCRRWQRKTIQQTRSVKQIRKPLLRGCGVSLCRGRARGCAATGQDVLSFPSVCPWLQVYCLSSALLRASVIRCDSERLLWEAGSAGGVSQGPQPVLSSVALSSSGKGLCAVLSMQLQLRGTFWGPVMGIRHGEASGGHRGRHSVAPRVLCCSAVAATWAAAAPRKVRDGFFCYYYFYFSCCLH